MHASAAAAVPAAKMTKPFAPAFDTCDEHHANQSFIVNPNQWGWDGTNGGLCMNVS